MYNESVYALGAVRSRIRDLFEFGLKRAAVVGAENILDYSLGNPRIPSPPEIDAAIHEILATADPLSVHGYTPAGGAMDARQAIAADLNARYDAGVGAEDLFLTCGSAPGLAAIFRALMVPGAEVLAVAPYFPEYKPFVEEAGCTFKVVPPDIPEFQIRLDAVEAMLTPATVAIILNSPNNPAGTVYTEQTLRELASLLTRKSGEFGHPIYIVSDEPYRELVYTDAAVPFIPLLYPNTLVCYSYSKSLSLPGERLGYVYVPKAAEDSAALYYAIAGASRAFGHVCAPVLWQRVIARCAHLRPNLEEYNKNRATLYQGLLDAGYEVARPDGAFYLFVKAPGGSSQEFSDRAKLRDLLVVPGDSFGCPEYFRACYCVSYDTILKSLPVFSALRKEYP